VFLDLSIEDIQDVAIHDATIWLKLRPAATSDLEQLTEQNYGGTLHVSYEGASVLETPIHAGIDSGVIQISNTPPELFEVFRALPRAYDRASEDTD
jgi:hypothetical protein